MHTPTACLALAAVLISSVASAAQQRRQLPIDTLSAGGHCVERDRDGVWADSPAYEARIDRTGLHFTPTLGTQAPRNFPVHLALESIRRGATRLATDTSTPPAQAGDRVELRRGAGGSTAILERYDVGDDAIEQSFVFASRPAGDGDLVVRLRLDSELRAAPGQRLPSLQLTRPGLAGGVAIGAVTGIAADGRRAAGHLNFDGGHLELVLPAAFVATAAYPLVLDPVIGGIFSGGSSFQDRRCDIAYDATNDLYILVWEIHRSATDVDIWAMSLKSDNTGRSGFIVIRTPGIQSRPCIANINATDMFMVVWQDSTKGNWDLLGRAVQASNRALSPVVTIAATAADEITPDLAGESTTTDDDVVCVWDDENVGIRAVEIEVKNATTVTVGTPQTLAVGKAPLHDNPAISKSGGAARRAAIVWEAFPTSIAVQCFTMDLAAASAPLTLPFTNEFPDVDGDGTDFTIVFQRPESGTASLGDIWCWGVSAPANVSQPMATRVAPRPLAATANDDEAHPTISFVGSRYVAAWADRDPNSTTDYRCHIQNLLPDCTTCGSALRVARSAGRRCDWPAIASHFSGGNTGSDQAWVLFQQEEYTATPPRSMIMVARYDAVAGGPVQSIASSCGGGGSLAITGAFAFGERVTFQLTGAPLAATTGMFVAGIPGLRTQLPCGTCSLLLGPIMLGVPLRSGGAQFSASIPCDNQLLNYELDTQVIVFGTASSPCAILPGLGASNILRATVRD